MSENLLWDNALEGFGGASARSLFFRSGINKEHISSMEKKRRFHDFLVYGFKRGKIVEFDEINNTPIFSGKSPDDVVDKILKDWPEKNTMESLDDGGEFYLYFIQLSGFAELIEGTRIEPLG
ncbi:hypothetical protein AAC691_13575 [Nguyenibacter vanlangensis]|uniref:Uncharacterized protein n=1 Tax=Nguyenibacter vanlangensis TaxID=1216886 RepID=A0A7Y7M7B5_9PROT|nr:hypothetical protein [Nguyenibacter vanlangensis]NVN11243.1 hypothetical protein [Nguyenibacter vanlangensis]